MIPSRSGKTWWQNSNVPPCQATIWGSLGHTSKASVPSSQGICGKRLATDCWLGRLSVFRRDAWIVALSLQDLNVFEPRF